MQNPVDPTGPLRRPSSEGNQPTGLTVTNESTSDENVLYTRAREEKGAKDMMRKPREWGGTAPHPGVCTRLSPERPCESGPVPPPVGEGDENHPVVIGDAATVETAELANSRRHERKFSCDPSSCRRGLSDLSAAGDDESDDDRSTTTRLPAD